MGSGTPESQERSRLLRKAREDAVAFIGISARTTGAVTASLLRSGYADDIAEEVAASLKDDGFLKDREVARALLARSTGKSAESREALRERMLRRGVPVDVAEAALEEAREDRTSAAALLATKFPEDTIAAVASLAEAERLAVRMARFLAARGFDPETAEEAVGKALDRFHG